MSTENQISTDKSAEGKIKMERWRSLVRVIVTYGAALFLFGGGSAFIIFLIYEDNIDHAINLFNTILPISAAVISYWFAGRSKEKGQN